MESMRHFFISPEEEKDPEKEAFMPYADSVAALLLDDFKDAEQVLQADAEKRGPLIAAIIKSAQREAAGDPAAAAGGEKIYSEWKREFYFSEKLEKVDYPLDKVNREVWDLAAPKGADLHLDVASAKDKKKKKRVDVVCRLDFEPAEDLTISRELTPYDKRVYMAVASLYTYQGRILTLGQLYYAMGHTGKPGASDREKILTSLRKLAATTIRVDNKEEAEAYRYDKFYYEGKALSLEMVAGEVNGVPCDCVIRLFREPALMSYARAHGQLTTVPREVLCAPLSLTDKNLRLEDYILQRIARAHGEREKILYKTIFDTIGSTGKTDRQRGRQKVRNLLDHYKKTGYIQGYTEDRDGVTIS